MDNKDESSASAKCSALPAEIFTFDPSHLTDSSTCTCSGVGMGKQVGSMSEEPQVRGCYKITFICTPTNQETVSVLEKTQANKTFRT